MSDTPQYDEFDMLQQCAAEHDIPYNGSPVVRREFVEVEAGRRLSALIWGEAPAEVVLLHGNRQNAHTWDAVAMSLARPLVAIDLPGHGHSDRPGDHRGGALCVRGTARDVRVAVERWAPRASAVVGMSLGGLTAIALGACAPGIVRRLVLVDITPGVTRAKARPSGELVGPSSFAKVDDMIARVRERNPRRSESSLRRGVLHNAVQRRDGRWVWRHARWRTPIDAGSDECLDPYASDQLWELLSRIDVPVLLCRGMAAESVVDDADEAQLLHRVGTAAVVRFPEAGHSIQGEEPVKLANAIGEFALHSRPT